MAKKIVIDVEARFTDNTKGVEETQKKIDKLESSSKKLKGKKWFLNMDADDKGVLKKLEKAEQRAKKFGRSKAETKLSAVDKASKVISKVSSAARSLSKKVWNVTMKAKDLATAPIRGILGLLKNPIMQAGAVLGVSIGLKDTVDTYKNFEAAMSNVKALSGATSSEMVKLTDKAKEMGATTKFTAKESAEAFNYMSMAGWKTGDMLNGIEGIMNLAAASGEDLAATSDIVTDALTAFRLKASDSGHFADVLATAASSANTTVSGMGETFKYVGTMAGSLGYSIEDVSLAVGLMANSGLKGSMAGTSLNAVITRLSTNAGGARDAIKELGVEFYNSDGSGRKLSDVMEDLRKSTAGMNEAQKSSFANTVAGMEAQKGLLAILNASEKDYNQLSDAINNADGAAKNMSETMLDNLQGSLTLLGSAADSVKLAFGERLAPYIKGAAQWLTDMMPSIETGLDSLMDTVDGKIDKMKARLKKISMKDEWQDADFFGKAKILWDDFIVEPFGEWWQGGGKEKLAGIAKDAGSGLGSGISAGLLTLFGIDAPSVAGEGANIGKQFASGFLEGFQGMDIAGAFGKMMSKLFSNAGKLLPGGQAADLSSVMSAVMLAKIGIPLLSAGGKGISLGKGIYKNGKSLMGSFSVAEELAGTGMANGTGLLGLFGKTGMALGSGATTAGGLAAAGGASIAGGVAAGATLMSGVSDIYRGFKADNEYDKKYNYAKGGTKLAGVGAGAAIGTAILPGVGTLIGAGVGGLAGWFASGKVADKIAGTADEAKKYSKESETAAQKTEELKKQQEKLAKNSLNKHFGKMSLSAKDMGTAVNNLVGTKRMSVLDQTTESITQMNDAYKTLQASEVQLKKETWMASIKNGAKLAADEMESLKDSVKSYADNAKQYLTESQYAATQSVQMLMGDSKDSGKLTESTDQYYGDLQSKLKKLSSKLSKEMNLALKDGKISIDEKASLDEIRGKIAKITSQIAKEDFEADVNILKAKAGGGDLSYESFGNLLSGAQEAAEKASEEYWNAYGRASVGKSDEEIKKLQEGLYGQLSGLQLDIGNMGLSTIREQYADDIGMFGKDIGTLISENTGTEIMNAARGLSEKTKAALGQMVEQMSPTTEQIQGIADNYKNLGLEIPSAINEYLSSASLFDALAQGTDKVEGWLSDQHIEVMPDVEVNPTYTMPDLKTADGLENGLLPSNLKPLTLNLPVNPTYSIQNPDTSGLTSALSSTAMQPVNPVLSVRPKYQVNNKFKASEGVDSSYSADTNVDVNAKYNANKFVAGNLIKSSYSLGTTVNVAVKYNQTGGSFKPKVPGGQGFRGGIFGGGHIPGFSDGGIVSGGSQFIKVAEEGDPEMVIPLSKRRKNRGMELWQKAGQYLGVQGYARGGMTDGTEIAAGFTPEERNTPDIPISTGNSGVEVNIGNVSVSVPVQGNGDVKKTILDNLDMIAEEIAGAINTAIQGQFANTPSRG